MIRYYFSSRALLDMTIRDTTTAHKQKLRGRLVVLTSTTNAENKQFAETVHYNIDQNFRLRTCVKGPNSNCYKIIVTNYFQIEY